MYENESNQFNKATASSYSNYGAANNGFAFAALVLGVCSLLSLLTIYLPLILGSIAIILAILSKGYGKKMVTAAKIGLGTALGSLSFLIGMIGIVFFSIYLLITSYTPAQLAGLGRSMDDRIEAQTGMSTESILGVSYEDLMEQLSSLKTPQ